MRISVVVPTYNRADLLPLALRSVLDQARGADEIIVVDDGSTDETPTVVGTFGPAVRYIWQTNGGQGAARFAGTLAATGDAICFLDSDDLLGPDALEVLEQALVTNADAAAAVGAVELMNADGTPAGPCTLNDADISSPGLALRLIKENAIRSPGCVLVRRSRVLAAGNWDVRRKIRGNEDWDLWIRLADIGNFVRVPKIVLKYRLHAASTSSNRTSMLSARLFMYRKHFGWKNCSLEKGAVIWDILKAHAYRALERLTLPRDVEEGFSRRFALEIIYGMPGIIVAASALRLRVAVGATRHKLSHH